jgi:hypothetical protein
MSDSRNIQWGGANCRIDGVENGAFRIFTAGTERLTVTNGGTVTGTDMIMQFPPTYPLSGTATWYQNGALTSTDGSMLNTRVPCALKVTKMYLYINGTMTQGSAVTYLNKNGAAQSGTISSTPSSNQTSGDSTPNITYAAGDRIGIKIIGSGINASWYHVTLLCERLA